jgi:LysM repeat protein
LGKTNKVVVPNSSVNRTSYVRPRSDSASAKTSGAPRGLTKIRVNQGDTINKIAARYGFSAVDLARLNGVLPDAVLPTGREISVPLMR